MIKRPIVVFVKGEQTYDDMEPETTELITEGVMEMDEGRTVLSYEESELTGMEGTTTRFIIEGDTVMLELTGMVQSQMIFELGKPSKSLYETPWGTMVVGIATTKLAHRINERGGVMEIVFTISVNHQVTGENRFKVRVKERAQ